MIDEGVTFDRPQMIYLGGGNIPRQLAKGFSIGVDVDVFHHLSGDMNDADGVKQPMGSATSFTAGVYMRINPSFLIKKILIITSYINTVVFDCEYYCVFL